MDENTYSLYFSYIFYYKLSKGGINMADGAGYGSGAGFALIVVLFILLIIVGAAYVSGGTGGDPVVVGGFASPFGFGFGVGWFPWFW